MKTICILKDGRPFWNEITGYLKFVNATIVPLDLKSLVESISEKNPDIVIAGERSLKEVSSIPQGISKLVITERDITDSKFKDIYLLKWPAKREAFLEMTSRLLYISERRLFRTVVSIVLKGGKETCLGKSLNFSLSGMAFKTDKALNVGDALTISFYIPNSDKRLSMEAEVMRNSVDPNDGSIYYGVKFLNVGQDVRAALQAFIKRL